MCTVQVDQRGDMAEEESLLTQEEMEAIGLEPDQVRVPCEGVFTFNLVRKNILLICVCGYKGAGAEALFRRIC